MFLVNWDKCTGCGNCIEACPIQAISMQNEKAVIDTDKCAGCGVCVDECPNDAICERELRPVIDEKAANEEINRISKREAQSDKQVLETRLGRKRAVSTSRQDTFFGAGGNRPSGIGNRKGRCNRGSLRGKRI